MLLVAASTACVDAASLAVAWPYLKREKESQMPSKKTFDLVVITALLLHPAVGLLRLASRRWEAETSGPLSTVGAAVRVAL